MKLDFLIESLGSGGAERQIVVTARGLAARGHRVRLFYYEPSHFHLESAREGGVIEVHPVQGRSRLARISRVMALLRKSDANVVIAFMQTPSLIAEVARLLGGRWGLVVSHRRGFAPGQSPDWRFLIKSKFHRFADRITVNSHTNRVALSRFLPGLNDRILTVYNAVNLEQFHPAKRLSTEEGLRVSCLARLIPSKGYVQSLQGLRWALDQGAKIRLDWYGQPGSGDKEEFERLRAELSLQDHVQHHPPVKDVPAVHAQSHALLLVTEFEGLPNAVCEGLASGLPILTSRVCDADNLVESGANGFSFPWGDSRAVGEAFLKLCQLSTEEREAFGQRSRARAEKMMAVERIAEAYEMVARAAMDRRKGPLPSWPEETPASLNDCG